MHPVELLDLSEPHCFICKMGHRGCDEHSLRLGWRTGRHSGAVVFVTGKWFEGKGHPRFSRRGSYVQGSSPLHLDTRGHLDIGPQSCGFCGSERSGSPGSAWSSQGLPVGQSPDRPNLAGWAMAPARSNSEMGPCHPGKCVRSPGHPGPTGGGRSRTGGQEGNSRSAWAGPDGQVQTRPAGSVGPRAKPSTEARPGPAEQAGQSPHQDADQAWEGPDGGQELLPAQAVPGCPRTRNARWPGL